jgi:hypothetical protein
MAVPGEANTPKPSGAACNLTVLNWAGFDGAATYTFDDGQPSHIAHWQELKATGVPLTFFLMTSSTFPEGYVETWKDAMASGSELGNHTHTHKRIAEYTDEAALAADVQTSENYLRDTLGQTAEHSFSYPFGELGWKSVMQGRFLLARSISPGTVKPLAKINPLELPTFAVTGDHTEKDFNAALDSSANNKTWVIFLYHSLLPGDNWYAGVSITSVVGSIEHAKKGGRLWLDTLVNVGAYWLAQKTFATLEPKESATGKTWEWTLPAHFPSGKFLRVTIGGGTLRQNGKELEWNPHGFYEVALDAGRLEWIP